MKVMIVLDGAKGTKTTYEPIMGNMFSVDTMQAVIDAFKRCVIAECDFFVEFEEV